MCAAIICLLMVLDKVVTYVRKQNCSSAWFYEVYWCKQWLQRLYYMNDTLRAWQNQEEGHPETSYINVSSCSIEYSRILTHCGRCECSELLILYVMNQYIKITSRKARLWQAFLLWCADEGYPALACRRQHIDDGFSEADTFTTTVWVPICYLWPIWHCVHVKSQHVACHTDWQWLKYSNRACIWT